MLGALLITLRESLETAPVAGVALEVVVSLAVGLALNALGVSLQGRAERIFEGITMLLASVLLTWMIFWMQHQGRRMQMGPMVKTHVERSQRHG